MRYYVMESRALQGLVEACEPRAGGAKARPELKLERLSREVDTLKKDVARYQALARASQKALGIAAPKPPEKKVDRKKRRKPVVRALKAVEGLRRSASPPESQPAEANVATG